MKLSRLLVYLLVLVAVLVYIFFVEIRYKRAESERKDKTSRLLQLDKDSINEIRIAGTNDQPIQIQKTGADSWRLVSPIETSADSRTTQALITAATLAQPEKVVIEKDVDWALYGLDKPVLALSFLGDGKTAEISFGATNPSRSSYYLRVDGDPRLFLVADTLEKSLDKGFFALRDKSVVKFTPDDVTEMQFINDGQQTDLTKIDGKWRITSPVEARAKPVAVRSFLMNLSDMKATEIIDSPPKEGDPYNLDNSLNKIVLKGKDLNRTITIGTVKEKLDESKASGKSVYVSVSGQSPVYVVETKFFETNKMDPTTITDKSIASFEPVNVEKVEIWLMGRHWSLSKSSDNKWKMESPEKIEKLEDWLVSGLLWSIKDLNFKSEIAPIPENLGDFHLDDPQLRISLHQKGSTTPFTLRMGWSAPPEKTDEKGDSVTDAVAPKEPSPDKKDDRKTEPKTPVTVYAIAEPPIDKPAIYTIDGGFVGRLRVDLEQLDRKK